MYWVIYESRYDPTVGPELFGPFSDEQTAIDWAILKKHDPENGKGGWDGKFTITEAVAPADVIDEYAEMEYYWPNKKTL